MSKIAVIETGGKQYVVAPGKVLKVEKLAQKAGDTFAFDKILLVADGDNLSLGKPYYDAKVSATLVAQDRLDKVITRKYHNKTRYRNTKGHRQNISVVRILDIQ
jgi:large subunit ribosomal protein L21